MAQSIIIVGPQGCGKTMNAEALAKAYGLQRWIEAEDGLPKNDHIILAHEIPRGAHGFQVVPFSEAIKKVHKPHPMTPNPTVRCADRREASA